MDDKTKNEPGAAAAVNQEQTGGAATSLSVESGFVKDMPPLDFVDEDNLGGAAAPGVEPGMEPGMEMPTMVTEEQVANCLRLLYSGAGFVTKEKEIWHIEDDELHEISVRLVVKINQVPAWAAAVAAFDTESVWLLLTYSLGKRIIATIRAKKAKKSEATKGGEIGGQPGTMAVNVLDYSQFDNSADPA